MHPAVSIILFTTLSGAGLGLTVAIGLGGLAAGGALAGTVLAVGLAGGGLVASVFHLRRPDRAWRALSQWRSSWLSREGILAPAALFLLAAQSAAGLAGVALPLLGWLAAVLAMGAVFATAMIYAQLRAVPAWHGPLTVVCFLLFAAAGGALLWAATAALVGGPVVVPASIAMVFLLAAWAAKLAWWRRLDKLGVGESTSASATGLRGRLRLLEPPHTGANYLTREMVHQVARRRAAALRRLALLAGLLLPAMLVGWALATPVAALTPAALVLAAGLHLVGVAAARWLFFAEAQHTVSLYYGAAQHPA